LSLIIAIIVSVIATVLVMMYIRSRW
jgi:hypothetical protein